MVYAVKITFADARIWRYIISATSKFIEAGYFEIGDEGFKFKALDPSRTALVEFTIPRESFDEFDVSGNHRLVADLESLGKILRSAERDDRISVSWTESSITLTFERRGISRSFTLSLRTEHEIEEIPALDLQLNNEYVTSGTTFYDAIASVEDVGETLWLSGDERSLKLKSVSDLGEAEIELSLDGGTLEDAKVEAPNFSVSFGMEYFSYMKQPIKLSDRVKVRVDSNMPVNLVLEYLQGATLSYYVAPRTE